MLTKDVYIISWTAAAIAAAVVASWYDLRTRRIPGWITYPFLGASILLAVALGALPGRLLAAVVAVVILALPGFRGHPADQRLAAAFALAVGFPGLGIFVSTMAAGLLVAVLAVHWRRTAGSPYRLRTFWRQLWLDASHAMPPVRVPGAPLICLAGLLSWVMSLH